MQLYAIEWLLTLVEEGANYEGLFRDAMPGGELTLWDGRAVEPEEAVEGLSGLIALGNAWESVDVLASLAIALDARGDSSWACLAKLRVEELLGRGRGSIHPGYAARSEVVRDAMETVGHTSESREEIAAFYPEGRRSADAWRASHESFVRRRLGEKRHPDTDAAFWAGFQEPAPPALPNGVLGFPSEQVKRSMPSVAMVGGGVVVIGALVVRNVRRRKARGG